jgi:hypothetical protein
MTKRDGPTTIWRGIEPVRSAGRRRTGRVYSESVGWFVMFRRVCSRHPRKVAGVLAVTGVLAKTILRPRKDLVYDIDETLVRTNKIGHPLPCQRGHSESTL